MRKLEFKNKLGKDFTLEERTDILLPLFYVAIQEYIEMRSAKICAELLLKYKNKHGIECGGVSRIPEQIGTRSN